MSRLRWTDLSQADKKYQLADWRIRPIPDEMLLYAKMDTHYLLYCYDVLRNKLHQQVSRCNSLPFPLPSSLATRSQAPSDLLDVWNRSRALCLQVYQKPAVPSST